MNEIEQKQIEEMAKEIQKSVDGCASYWAKLIAKHLIEQGYYNCKDKIVLSKEELNTLINNIEKSSEIKAEELEKVRKETVREILNEWRNTTFSEHFHKIKELAKQNGVEVN